MDRDEGALGHRRECSRPAELRRGVAVSLAMRRWISGAVGLLTALAGADAGADSLATARSQPLREVSHAVDVRIVDGVARYTVRRSFANAGTVADEATVAIDLPPGAAATGHVYRYQPPQSPGPGGHRQQR